MAKEQRRPGDFIIEVATRGQDVTSLFLFLFSSKKARDIAACLSISATILAEAGNTTNRNAEYFKDSFQSKFESLLAKFTNVYDKISAACEKVTSLKPSDNPVKPFQGPLEKLIWAFGMNEEEFSDFSEWFKECYEPSALLNTLVNLVVLQINAQRRELTPSEQTLLYRCKFDIPSILETLREFEIGTVVQFSLVDTSKLVNVSQIVEAAELASNRAPDSDDASGTTIAATVCDRCKGNTDIQETKGKEQATTDDKLAITQTEPEKTILFEMYKLTYRNSTCQQVQSSWSLFKVPLKRERTESQSTWHIDRVYTSQDDLKLFIEKERSNNANYEIAKMDGLLNPPAACSGLLYTLFNNKNNEGRHRSYHWSLECLVSTTEEKKPRRFRREQSAQPDSYIVVIRGEGGSFPTLPPGPPGPRPGSRPSYHRPPPGQKPIITIRPNLQRFLFAKEYKTRKTLTKISLTQRESEVVINDFLASFSTLYDGIPNEERGIELSEIELNSGYDSADSASTSSSSSLADD